MSLDENNNKVEDRGINGFDFDGVISLGIYPGPRDVIITGRSYEEAEYINKVLKDRGIYNAVYFNMMPKEGRKRSDSGKHKARVLGILMENGVIIDKFFEDDEIQVKEIKNAHPDLPVVHVKSDLVEK
jgi:hypothetical protein